MTIRRREFLQLGLGGGVGALLSQAGFAGRAAADDGYLASDIHRRHPLEFRLDSDFVPDLSDTAAALLARALWDFLAAEHPRGVTMTFWELNPREMPFLRDHAERLVAALFQGVAENLDLRPVDPILVLALLYNESRFHPTVVSPAGAVGMAQFMPDTAEEYGLVPVARRDLWSRYLEVRNAWGRERRQRVDDFCHRFRVRSFAAEDVIERALQQRDLAVLAEYRTLAHEPNAADAARSAYAEAVAGDLSEHDFFAGGRETLRGIDGRVGYAAVRAAVRYVARQLAEHQGMVSTVAASYNAGPGAVVVASQYSILHRFGDIPPIGETVRYVQRVLAVYTALKYRLFRLVG